MIELSEKQIDAIASALRVAAVQYIIDAKVASLSANTRETFRKQSEEAVYLANLLQNSMGVTIHG